MLIDTHTHLSNMLGFIMTEEMIKEMMEKYNIDYCIVSNAAISVDSKQVNSGEEFTISINIAPTQLSIPFS